MYVHETALNHVVKTSYSTEDLKERIGNESQEQSCITYTWKRTGMKFHKKQDDELTPTCESKTGMYA